MWSAVGPGNGSEHWSPEGFGLALALVIITPFLVVQGVSLLLRGRLPAPRLSDDELLRRIVSGERPLAVCLDCRTVTPVPPCEHCHQSSSCVEISTRTDVKHALSLLHLEEPARLNAPPELDPSAQDALRSAIAEAKRRQHAKVMLEHLLLGLLSTPRTFELLKRCGADAESLREQLEAWLDATATPMPAGEPQPTPRVEHALHAASARALASGRDFIECGDLLYGVCAGTPSPVLELLEREQVTRMTVSSAMAVAQALPGR